ncbi:DUF1080 domain-containing protein [Membranicola marinus]|uniref:DUF1080 domain-containing protein n=1 Tax=Membranihabitans marinus TaxID=1227546 RepID=A0A953HSU1_9BACT|nr:DUF1080 domain-containing protein [Membranihabitans marinus]MBY5957273.1 DUF1080 domain-containing protein [Membranihabitans marinus]
MKTTTLFLFLAIVLGLSSCGQEPPANTLSDKEKSDGWKLLFDGNSLDGWRDYQGTEVTGPWKVVDGMMEAQGEGADEYGYLSTTDQYENFILTFNWKISEGGNSGVLYHVMERDGYKVPYVTGPEYQVLDDVGFPAELEDWQLTGADYAMHVADPDKKELKPVGEWNSSKIVFDNGHVEHWLNGKKIVEFEAWTEDWFERKNSGKWADVREYGLPRKGYIVLQDHGAKAWYKDIKIKELPRKPEKNVELFNGEDLSGWEIYGTEKWYVEDGEMICESGPDEEYGYLATNKYYNNFDFSVDFLQEADGNSGIFFRSFIEDEVKVNGWQVEVAPPGHNSGGIYESYGRGWIHKIPEGKGDVNMGEWNTMRIKLEGDHVQTWLNGELMTDMKDDLIGSAQGRIALQIHSGGGIRVRWKNFKLDEL